MMGLYDVVRDGQAEAKSGNLILDGRAAIKALKQTPLFLFRYSRPMIGDLKINHIGAVGQVHGDWRTRRRIFESIVEHLLKRQFDQAPVERELRQRFLRAN